MSPRGWSSYSLVEKLKGLKHQVTKWNKEVSVLLDSEIGKIQGEIDVIDKLEDQRGIMEEENLERKSLKIQLVELVIKEYSSWAQKCKMIWLKQGDENTNLFHIWASFIENRNFIASLEDRWEHSLIK